MRVQIVALQLPMLCGLEIDIENRTRCKCLKDSLMYGESLFCAEIQDCVFVPKYEKSFIYGICKTGKLKK